MVDKNGRVLHIGEEVTFTEEARPERLIGRHGTVEALGEVRIKIKLLPRFGFEREEAVRIEPGRVLCGHHRIMAPMMTDLRFRRQINELLLTYLEDYFAKAVQKGIISVSQQEQLIGLFDGLE